MLSQGSKAPDFELTSGDGESIRLKDFRGKKVILYFYPKDNTSGCTKEACSFNDHLPLIHRKGAVVLGVSADSVESHKGFARKFRLRFPLLSDPDRVVTKAYGVWKEKSMYGRKFMGIERTTFLIDERGIIEDIKRKVKVDGHTEAMLELLEGDRA